MSKAYLTIDDFPTANTPKLVDYLVSKGITPIFNAVGQHVEKYTEEAVYALKKGAIVGNHSYSHPAFSELSVAECIEEIEKCESILEQLYKKACINREYKIFRFPYGNKGENNKEELQEYLRKNNFCRLDDSLISFDWWKTNHLDTDIDMFWTFDYAEYKLSDNSGYTYEDIVYKINDPNPPMGGSLVGNDLFNIILMHDTEATEKVMPGYYKTILDYTMECGVEFVKPNFIKTI